MSAKRFVYIIDVPGLGPIVTLKAGSVVDLKTLVSNNIVNEQEAKEYGVKILGDGEIKNALTIKLPISKNASQKIIKAGGKVEN